MKYHRKSISEVLSRMETQTHEDDVFCSRFEMVKEILSGYSIMYAP